jgi:NitT/TauT family transport system substrate-binding protein
MRLRVLAIIVIAGMITWGWGQATSNAANPVPSKSGNIVANGETIRIQLIAGLPLSLPLYVGVDQGFFAAHGLKPVLVSLATGPLGMQALTSGSIEIGGTGTEVIMNAYARGADIQLIAALITTNPFTLVVNKDVPLPHLKNGYPAVMQDLKDIIHGTPALGSSAQLYSNALFANANLDPTSVKFIAVGSPVTAYPALVTGKVQAYMATEPMQTLCAVEKTCVSVVNLRKGEGPAAIAATNGAAFTFAAQRSYINANPIVVQAFIQAIADTDRWMQDPANFDKLLKVAKSYIGVGNFPDPDALLASMLKDNLSYFGATISRTAIVNLSRFLVSYKQIPTEIDPKQFVYSEAPHPAP